MKLSGKRRTRAPRGGSVVEAIAADRSTLAWLVGVPAGFLALVFVLEHL